MNSPSRVITFVNAAHFIDHYAMLIFAAAVIIMGPALGMAYSELLPYATPGFVAFGAGSLITGWLGDRWSRRHMMVIFFVGIGASMIAVGFVQTPLQLGAALLAIGLFASIYHPVGTAMIVSYADKLGREMGLNGVWGNLGVASSALVTGVIGQYLGWRWAFIVPGIVTILIGVAFAQMVVHEDRSGSRQAAAQARIAKQDMWRVLLALADRGDRDIHHLQRHHRGDAETVRRAAGRPDQQPGDARGHRGRRLCVRRDDAIHHRQADRPLFAEDGDAAAVVRAGAVHVFRGDAVEPAADHRLHRHRDGRVRPGHRQRRHGRQIHHR